MSLLIRISCRNISTTKILYAQPPKKKKRIDPAILRTRVERKIVKYEREVERIEREPRQPIPILEYQYSGKQAQDLRERPGRKLEEFGVSESTLKAAHKLWAHYCSEQSRIAWDSIRKAEKAQAHALDTLKSLDLDLYNRTVSIEDSPIIPFDSDQVKRETPSNKNYVPPDGYVKDVTKDYVM